MSAKFPAGDGEQSHFWPTVYRVSEPPVRMTVNQGCQNGYRGCRSVLIAFFRLFTVYCRENKLKINMTPHGENFIS